ncbi:MAG: Pycsar system effector family protein [Croceibacterium sp.]
MNDLDALQRQLDRVLGFIPRVEARINGLFGVNTFLLAIGALNVSAGDLKLWYVTVPGAAFVGCMIISYAFLYRANFPDDRGGHGSLIFFKEIQKRTEAGYQAELLACTEENFRNDLIGQIWRNSEILCDKYQGVKSAIVWAAVSLVPFFVFISASATVHGRVPLFATS